MAHYLGLDLGGTNIKAGVTDDAGRLLAKVSLPTHADQGPEAVMAALAAAAEQAAAAAKMALPDIAAIGIGSPGPIDFRLGVVISTPNIPGFEQMPLAQRIAERTGRPTSLENDANAAAFAEFWAGAGKDPSIRDLIVLTLGTGVGSGIILDGKVLHGSFGVGGEAGHMIVVPEGRPCGCGQKGCLETYASASRTARRAEEALDAGEPSHLRSLYLPGRRPLSSEEVFQAAQAGDPLALRIVDETAAYLGVACVNLCRLFDPQMILFAGGMILAGEFLFHRIRTAFGHTTWSVTPDQVRILPATLGTDAGVIGAAGIAWDAHQNGRI